MSACKEIVYQFRKLNYCIKVRKICLVEQSFLQKLPYLTTIQCKEQVRLNNLSKFYILIQFTSG